MIKFAQKVIRSVQRDFLSSHLQSTKLSAC